MKLRIAVITILCIGLACSVSMLSNQTYAQGKKAASANGPVVMPKITVLNPMGTPPPITLVPQAPRPAPWTARPSILLIPAISEPIALWQS